MIDWEKALKEQTKENLLECEKNLEKKEYRTKIEKFCRKFEFDFNEVFAKVKSDHHFRACFAKEAKKQNIYEKALSNYISSLLFVSDFQKLPNGGKNALYVDHGDIRKRSEYSWKPTTKSIDFFWNIKTEKGKIINFYS